MNKLFRTSLRNFTADAANYVGIHNRLKTQGLRHDLQALRNLIDDIGARKTAASKEQNISNTALVDDFEKKFNQMKYDPASHGELTGFNFTDLLAQAKVEKENAEKKIVELEELLEKVKSNRTTEETTVDEVMKLFPDIEKEIQAENKSHDFGKNVVN
eukprot:maker-scaffold_3-snap-gene-12.13-mRNA-1 protein AED:0.00 eAED:0.00 QI:126/1/1/1/0/0/2/97/157